MPAGPMPDGSMPAPDAGMPMPVPDAGMPMPSPDAVPMPTGSGMPLPDAGIPMELEPGPAEQEGMPDEI